MRRRTIRRAVELAANAMPDEQEMQESILRGRRGIIEDSIRQVTTQQRLYDAFEAKKPGSLRARNFAKTVTYWQKRTDKAIAKYNELAAEYGRPPYSPDDQAEG